MERKHHRYLNNLRSCLEKLLLPAKDYILSILHTHIATFSISCKDDVRELKMLKVILKKPISTFTFLLILEMIKRK